MSAATGSPSTPLHDERVLVTGGAGFIGSHLVDHLLAQPGVREVRVLDNLATGHRHNLADAQALAGDRLEVVEGDVRDEAVLGRACRDATLVFHLACLGVRHSLHDPVENHAVNATGTLAVLQAARASGVRRFVHVSSSEVFGTARDVPMGESHRTWPETVYGGSKLAGEAYARAFYRTYGLATTVVRPFNNYGPRSHHEGDSGEVIPRSAVRVLSGLPPVVFGDGSQTRDFLHVKDCARALVALAQSDRAVGETVNVGYGQEHSIRDVCRLLAELAGRPELAPVHLDPRPADVQRLWVDNSLVQELVSFRPEIGLEEGLAGVLAWFAARPEGVESLLGQMTDRNWSPPVAVAS